MKCLYCGVLYENGVINPKTGKLFLTCDRHRGHQSNPEHLTMMREESVRREKAQQERRLKQDEQELLYQLGCFSDR